MVAALIDELFDELVHHAKPLAVDVDKGNRAALIVGNAEYVVCESRRKTAAGTHHCDLDRALHRSRKAFSSCVLRMTGVTFLVFQILCFLSIILSYLSMVVSGMDTNAEKENVLQAMQLFGMIK